MKSNSSISMLIRWQIVLLAVAVIAAAFAGPAYCQIDGTALLLQQAPEQGGRITPSVGVHHFESGTEISLTAIAKPGYQFVYWLGDVGDPTASSTIVYLDSPKIVIAVFERAEYEFLIVEEGPQNGRGGGGGLRRSAGDYSRQGGGSGGKRPPKFRWPQPPEEEEPPEVEEDFPVPEPVDEEEDFPVPIPEPATGVLLVLGSLFAFGRHRMKRLIHIKSHR